MRITNSMMTNSMQLHIQRNMTRLNDLNIKWATEKRIQAPSCDPIAAARALKFRTSITETQQYRANVAQGKSWMEVTDRAFREVTDIVQRIHYLAVRGANGDMTWEERQAVASEYAQLKQQLHQAMNTTYAGRYVFSGFRTDNPMVFHRDMPPDLASYQITQSFTLRDMESIRSFQRIPSSQNDDGQGLGDTDEPIVRVANIIKLAYTSSPPGSLTNIRTNGIMVGGPPPEPPTIRMSSLSDRTAYAPADNEIVFIEETGELVLGANIVSALRNGDQTLEVTYDKRGFERGDLNPRVNFNATRLMDPDHLRYAEITGALNDIGFDAANIAFAPALDTLVAPWDTPVQLTLDVGAIENIEQFVSQPGGSITFNIGDPPNARAIHVPYNQASFIGGVLTLTISDPAALENLHYIDELFDPGVMDVSMNIGRHFNMDNQELQFEVSVHTHITVNSLGKDVLTDQMFADINNFIRFVNSIQLSERDLVMNKFELGFREMLFNEDGTPLTVPFDPTPVIVTYPADFDVEPPLGAIAGDIHEGATFDGVNWMRAPAEPANAVEIAPGVWQQFIQHPPLDGDELIRAVDEQLVLERQEAEKALRERFNNFLGLIERHATNVSQQNTDLASRINRMDLIYERLEENYVTFREMLSENEDADLFEVSMDLALAETTFNASLMAGSRIIQMSLIDFLR